MTTTAKTHQLLSISEIADLLVPALRESEAEQAFLCGPYVRAARNGDIRRYDELHMLIIADVQGTSLEQAEYFGLKFDFAEDLRRVSDAGGLRAAFCRAQGQPREVGEGTLR